MLVSQQVLNSLIIIRFDVSNESEAQLFASAGGNVQVNLLPHVDTTLTTSKITAENKMKKKKKKKKEKTQIRVASTRLAVPAFHLIYFLPFS